MKLITYALIIQFFISCWPKTNIVKKSYISISNIDLCKKATKYVYEYLILKYSQEPISIYNKWNVELDINYDRHNWANIFERLNKTTKSTNQNLNTSCKEYFTEYYQQIFI